jgi:hypothetical protein
VPDRRGPFWDVLEGRVPPPSAAMLLGWKLEASDHARGTMEVAFAAVSSSSTRP